MVCSKIVEFGRYPKVDFDLHNVRCVVYYSPKSKSLISYQRYWYWGRTDKQFAMLLLGKQVRHLCAQKPSNQYE